VVIAGPCPVFWRIVMKTIAFLIITFLGAVPVSAQHVAVYATGSFNGGTFTPPFGKNDISGLEVRRRINPGVEVVVAPLQDCSNSFPNRRVV